MMVKIILKIIESVIESQQLKNTKIISIHIFRTLESKQYVIENPFNYYNLSRWAQHRIIIPFFFFQLTIEVDEPSATVMVGSTIILTLAMV